MVKNPLTRTLNAVAEALFANADLLTELDEAIGDGDHGINMRRGLKAVINQQKKNEDLFISKALQNVGTTLVMNIGGASGPLYGSLCIGMGKAAEFSALDMPTLSKIVGKGVAEVKKRGKSDVGEKTMLDVLVPVAEALQGAVDREASVKETISRVCTAADIGLASTRDMPASKGRAAFMGERSVGHLDPGAKSSHLIVHAICDCIKDIVSETHTEEKSKACVGIVIVSHSDLIAKGTMDMVRQMAGDEVPLAWCGGNPDRERGLGTDVAAIKRAIEAVWNPSGVAILVDLGGAETNSEMAIEMLPEAWRPKVLICNAPIVEGAVMAATESAGGGSLAQVRATAEDMDWL